MHGRLTGYTLNRDGTQNITVTVAADFAQDYETLKDSEVAVEIRKARPHRSRDANAYAWALIDQIAERSHIRKSEVYRNAIRDIGGVSQEVLMPLAAVETFRDIWEGKGLGNQVEVGSVDPLTEWATLRVYYGSSTYNTKQMSCLLDLLIQDAEAYGIPTITPREEEKLLHQWTKRRRLTNGNHSKSGENHTGSGCALSEAECG